MPAGPAPGIDVAEKGNGFKQKEAATGPD